MVSRTLYVKENGVAVAKTVPQLELGPREVLIKPKAVAFNPCDGKLAPDGIGFGCDLAGDVIEVGAAVSKLKVGDKVATMLMGGNTLRPWDGAYASEVKTFEDLAVKFPSLSFSSESELPSETLAVHYEAAAAHTLSTWTAALAIVGYSGVDLVPKSKTGSWALVYGASTSLGFEAAQLLQYVGYDVIVVASAKHQALLQGLGHFIDRNEDWVKQARDLAGDNIDMVLDTVSGNETASTALKAASRSKKVNFNVFLPVGIEAPDNIQVNHVMVFLLTHDEIGLGGSTIPSPPNFRERRTEIIDQVRSIIQKKSLKSLPVHVVGESLDSIPKAYEKLLEGASGFKIVVRFK